MRIGITVLDWGIGGVDLLSGLRRARPDLDLRYRSDSGSLPWGRLSPGALTARVATLLEEETAAGADAVLLACNAASTILPRLRTPRARDGTGAASPQFGVHGVIAPGLAMVLAGPWRDVGVLGGQRTIRSGAWTRPLRGAGLQVRGRIAQPLSARVEAADLDSAGTRALVAGLCAPLRACEVVVLACTHYSAAADVLQDALPGVVLLDPAAAALVALLQALPDADDRKGPARTGRLRAFTSGDPVATRAAALGAFGVDLGPVLVCD